jgi:alkylation response protein AidB-like acyl-CoA dehydrogenase
MPVLVEMPTTLRYSESDEELRSRIRSWIVDNDMGPAPERYEDKVAALTQWQAALHSGGFMGLSWPQEYGGSGRSIAAEGILAEEMARSSRPELINRLALYTWGPTILDWGTDDQKARFLPGMLDASEIWCQGFSEPEAGSDLAAVRTFAQVDGDELVINGQKVWTTRAELSKWNGLLVRTDREAQRHRGLSVVMLDMTSPGITIRPLPQILNEPHFSEVFFDDVRVPVENVLGGVNNGWRVAMDAMAYERGLFVLERQIRLRMRLAELTQRLIEDGLAETNLELLGSLTADLDLLQGQVYRTLAGQILRDLPAGSTSVDKLHLAEMYQRLYGAAFDILGDAVASDGSGEWMHDLLESRAVSIYSGTSEIQRNIVAGRMLGIR